MSRRFPDSIPLTLPWVPRKIFDKRSQQPAWLGGCCAMLGACASAAFDFAFSGTAPEAIGPTVGIARPRAPVGHGPLSRPAQPRIVADLRDRTRLCRDHILAGLGMSRRRYRQQSYCDTCDRQDRDGPHQSSPGPNHQHRLLLPCKHRHVRYFTSAATFSDLILSGFCTGSPRLILSTLSIPSMTLPHAVYCLSRKVASSKQMKN
jgi:hypothetical protein